MCASWMALSNEDGRRTRCRRWYIALALGAALALGLGWPVSSSALATSVAGAPATDVRAQSTIAANLMDSLAIKADGSLWLWGLLTENDEGEIIGGFPVPTRIGTDNDWALVSDGFVDSLAIKTDGTLWDVGAEYVFDDPSIYEPTGIVTTQSRIGSDRDWAAVSAGGLGGSSLALKESGSLWALEYDYEADEDDPTYGVLIPTRIGADSDWTAVSTSPVLDSLALKADGSLWLIIWEYEDLEDAENFNLVYRAERIGADNDWAVIAAGAAHYLALKTDGSLWAWGENEEGQLGDGTDTTRIDPIRIGTDNDWVQVSAGLVNSMGVKADGSLWTWGNNEYGQLGDGTTVDRAAPGRVGTSNKWRSAAAGYMHALGLRADGTLWAWGDNAFGQLGDNTSEGRRSPVQVLSEVRVPEWSQDEPPVFSDVAASYYQTAIYDLAGRGIITGFEDGTFRPDDPVSRQQFAKMIVKALAIPVMGSEVCPFGDVVAQAGADPFYPSKYVAVCAQQGITQGKTATTFAPEATITRQQLITMVARAADLGDPPVDFVPRFTASQFALEEHYRNARKAAYAGLLDAVEGLGPSFDFGAAATRGECTHILYLLLVSLEY